MKPMFVDDAAKARMAGWFETFREAIAVPTVRGEGGLVNAHPPLPREGSCPAGRGRP